MSTADALTMPISYLMPSSRSLALLEYQVHMAIPLDRGKDVLVARPTDLSAAASRGAPNL